MTNTRRLRRIFLTGGILFAIAMIGPEPVAAQLNICCQCTCQEPPTIRCRCALPGGCIDACEALGCDGATTISGCECGSPGTQECQLNASETACECVNLPTPVPTEPAETGACCIADECVEMSESGCSGVYLGDGTTCDTESCTACCRCEGPPEVCAQTCQEVPLQDIEGCAEGCPVDSCVLNLATGSSCEEDCRVTGCCELEGVCVMSVDGLCESIGGTLLQGQICDPQSGGCNPATPTATATPTLTPTATPTNTPASDGAPCTDPVDCVSGNCANDVCCDEPCTEVDRRCNLQGNVGTCSDVAITAPAVSRTAMLLGFGILAMVAALALRRRREIHRHRASP